MNEYFKFIFQRAGAPPPSKIVIFEHSEYWANCQILEEVRLVWPSAMVALIKTPSFGMCDLVVVPFIGDASIDSFSFASKDCSRWVMFYGLNGRQIRVLEFGKAMKFLRTTQRLRRIRRVLLKTRFLRLLQIAIRFWKDRVHQSTFTRLIKRFFNF